MFGLLARCVCLVVSISLAGFSYANAPSRMPDLGVESSGKSIFPVEELSFQMNEKEISTRLGEGGMPDSVDYASNGNCPVFVIIFNHVSRFFYDRDDPHCANRHG